MYQLKAKFSLYFFSFLKKWQKLETMHAGAAVLHVLNQEKHFFSYEVEARPLSLDQMDAWTQNSHMYISRSC